MCKRTPNTVTARIVNQMTVVYLVVEKHLAQLKRELSTQPL